MPSSKLSIEAAREMLADAQNPAYREMNRIQERLDASVVGQTPDENLAQLVLWLRVLARFGADLSPDRTLPRTDINVL